MFANQQGRRHRQAPILRWRRVALQSGIALVSGLSITAAAASGTLGARARLRAASDSAGAVSPSAIPIGDGHVSTTPQVGYVDSCTTSFAGAGSDQSVPWIDTQTGTWNSLTKPAVQGSVSWPAAYYHMSVSGQSRIVSFNDLPIDHTTGVFPISASDPAYAYDRNPNHIAAHQMRWTLPLDPTAASTPSCTSLGPIGVLNDGVLLFNALDAAGRDAGAHEVQDQCGGHPDSMDEYHHHTIPSCILDQAPNGTSTLVGYALDGYGIYVQKSADGTLPTNADLDACHGTTSPVMWNGTLQDVYHYVATLEYPYTVGCFHGTPIRINRGAAGGTGASGSGAGHGGPGTGKKRGRGPGNGGPQGPGNGGPQGPGNGGPQGPGNGGTGAGHGGPGAANGGQVTGQGAQGARRRGQRPGRGRRCPGQGQKRGAPRRAPSGTQPAR